MGQRGARHSRLRSGLLLGVLLVAVIVVLVLPVLAEGRGTKHATSRRRRKKFRAGVGKDFSEFLLVIGAIMTCVIAPVFLAFLHSIFKDPATPALAREAWRALKGKLLSYLGKETAISKRNISTAFPERRIDQSLSTSHHRCNDRRHELSGVVLVDDGVDWASNEGARCSHRRTVESTPMWTERSNHAHSARKPTAECHPLLLHEYASYTRRRPEEKVSKRGETGEAFSIATKAEPTAPIFSPNLLFQRHRHANRSHRVAAGINEDVLDTAGAPPIFSSIGLTQRGDTSNHNNGGIGTTRGLGWSSGGLVNDE